MKKIRSLNSEQGFTLVEVLVALVVLAVGLLGVAGLQTQGLAGSSDASIRSQAVLHSYDMAERMKVNRDVASNMVNQYYEIDYGVTPANSLPSLVKQDLDSWLAAVATLPSGQGKIDIVGVTGGVEASIYVRWSEHGQQQTMQVDTRL